MTFEKKFTQQSVFPMAVHPGHMIMEYSDCVSISKLPQILGCSEERFNNLISLKPDEGLTRLMCLRLAHYFKTSYEYWYNMQKQYDEALLYAQEEFLVQDLYNKPPIPLEPDTSDKEWTYYKEREYHFSEKKGYNSLPIRTQPSGFGVVGGESIDVFEVWLNNTWTSPTRILAETYLVK